MQTLPSLTTFVESREQADDAITKSKARSRGEYLQQHIGQDEVIDILMSMNGRVAVALNHREIRQDGALVDLLRHFNTKGIPVDLWANLEDHDGYWIHAGNVPTASAAVLEMLNSLERANVDIKRVGLDLEFPATIMLPRFNIGEWRRIAPWRFSQDKATEALHTFVDKILGQSLYGVDVYEIPILSDYSWMRRLLGIPKAPAIESTRYRRVGMVYTSVKPPIISADWFIEKYSKGKGRIPALGIVSSSAENPGRDMNFGNLLDDKKLHRDVRKALSLSPEEFYVFALNGLRMIERVRKAIQLALQRE